jgi:aminoglycoside/choline kinase family phosphotransferase
MNQPFVPLHNDFERRNLILNKEEIYIIDFQDCCVGPMGIDLASILYEHDRNYDEELILSQIRSFLSKKSSNMKENKVLEYIFVALAHRSIRIVSTFVSYFLEGKLLNRKKDLEKFIIRIIFSLNKLNRTEEAQIIKKLL